MKIVITVILAVFILFGCSQNSKQKNEIEKSNTTKKAKNSIEVENTEKTQNSIELLNLIAIDTVDSKSKNIYKKYGIEFSGNCYECDLAELSINEKTITLTNVCDTKLNQVFEIAKIVNTQSKIEIQTKENNFVFTEIHKTPIYELKIEGKNIPSKNLRISAYYTLKRLLKKFEQHDCGDFQG